MISPSSPFWPQLHGRTRDHRRRATTHDAKCRVPESRLVAQAGLEKGGVRMSAQPRLRASTCAFLLGHRDWGERLSTSKSRGPPPFLPWGYGTWVQTAHRFRIRHGRRYRRCLVCDNVKRDTSDPAPALVCRLLAGCPVARKVPY